MNEIDKFDTSFFESTLDAWASIPSVSRKISNEKLDGYYYDDAFQCYMEGDDLLRSRIA